MENLIKTIERFIKKEITPQIDEIEKSDYHSPILTNLLKNTAEIGLNILPLPEESGGAGLNIPLLGEVLRRIARESAGFSTILLFHFSALFPFLIDDRGRKIITEFYREKNDTFIAVGWAERIAINNGTFSSPLISVKGLGDYLTISGESDEQIIFAILPAIRDHIKIIELSHTLGLKPFHLLTISLEGLKINEQNLLIYPEKEGRRILQLQEGFIRALICATAVGNAEGAILRAMNYTKERYQGCDIIINHRSVQTMLGRIVSRVAASLSLTEKVLERAQKFDFDKAGIAKSFVTENCEWACSDCLQLFGGYGYMKDFYVEKHLRDAKTLAALMGENPFLLREYISNHKDEELFT